MRALIFVGENGPVKDSILEYVEEKDIPKRLENPGLTSSIDVFYTDKVIFELYASPIYSVAEIVGKYLANCGPKLMMLLRYISQVENQRTTAPFDHTDLRALQDVHFAFMKHHDMCMEEGLPYNQDFLLKILKDNPPR